jgi:hypothetical protein
MCLFSFEYFFSLFIHSRRKQRILKTDAGIAPGIIEFRVLKRLIPVILSPAITFAIALFALIAISAFHLHIPREIIMLYTFELEGVRHVFLPSSVIFAKPAIITFRHFLLQLLSFRILDIQKIKTAVNVFFESIHIFVLDSWKI